MPKLCVVFPGRHYSCDRSLLYYPSKIRRDKSYQIVRLEYNEPFEVVIEPPFEDFKRESLEYIESHLEKIDFDSYESVIFLTDSIGGTFAGRYRENHHRDKVKIIFISPLSSANPYFLPRDLILSSDNDPLFPNAREALIHFGQSYIFPYRSHDFEVKDNSRYNLSTRTNAVNIIEKYISALEQTGDKTNE